MELLANMDWLKWVEEIFKGNVDILYHDRTRFWKSRT